MHLAFYGAAGEVGRSCIHVHGRHSFLLDAGVKLKGQEEQYPQLGSSVIRSLDKLVLSHAHLDHTGYAPALYAKGFKGKTVCTKPTRDLTQLLLADYLRLNPGALPYKQQDVNALLSHLEILEYGEPDTLKAITLSDAGHILGAAMVHVQDEKRLLYTGDFNPRPTRLLSGANLENLDAEILVTEGTYGGEKDAHASSKDLAAHLVSSVQKTLDKGGKVLIPTFAIGRGQEVLFLLESHMRSGVLERVPIFVDGMVNTALRIHRHNALYLKDEVKRRILTSEDDPFKSPFYVVPKTKDRSDVFEKEKAIVVAPSGMLNGGPALFYLQKLARDRKNKVILTGYQASGTMGRQLSEGAKSVEINGETVPLKLEIEEARLSAHADRHALLDLAHRLPSLQQIFIVHGEESKCLELKEGLREQARKQKRELQVHVPSLGEEFEV